ncbi:LamG-like jellyroll fold domain-containing protein [Luteolibacter marinus]|uniref:LamG-like jellyroll fold domain-containing protein n=1 Tax=Luteolibacter marinus TaxID=2776705 RepID=UPI0018675564|nr:LamG-like jellyroll fold domain-containing protein [Luteolibacter marinus]
MISRNPCPPATGVAGSLPCRILAISLLATHARAELTNRWSFNDPAGDAPSGTTMVDSISGAVATVIGQYVTLASFDGAALRLPGTSNGNHSLGFMSAYVDLPNGIVSSKANFSVEIWATPFTTTGYDRLFDFGRTRGIDTHGPGAADGEIVDVNGQGQTPGATQAEDNLYLSLSLGADPNSMRMDAMINADGSNPDLYHDTNLATTLGTSHHYVFTFEDGAGSYGSNGGQVKWYRDGSLLHTADVDFRLSQLEDVNNWLGRSQWANDWNADASYDECRIYDHALSLGEVTANLAAGPDVLVDPPDPVAPPVADHLWTFTTQAQSEVPSGVTFTDELGGLIATLKGNGASLNGGAVVLPGSTTGAQPASSISAYIDLPNGIATATDSVTFEAWATPLSSKNWQRLFDFGRCNVTSGPDAAPGEIVDGTASPAFGGYDNLSLTLNTGGNLNSQQLEGQIGGNAAQYSSTTAATVVGTRYHYVLVVEDGAGTHGSAGCQARWYRNGALQNSEDFPFHLSQLSDVNNWIGRSMYSGDSNSNLSLDEFRIYRRVITPAEIVASYGAGPDPTVGPPEPPAPAPVPSRRWTFDTEPGDALPGTTFLDEATGEIATVQGNGATLNGSELVLEGAITTGNQIVENISSYLDLPNGIISSRPSLTVEAWLTPLSSRNWQRVFDFGNSSITSGTGAEPGEIIDGGQLPGNFVANDNLFLSLNVGGTLGSHRLAAKIGGGGETSPGNTDLSTITEVGTEYHFVMTVADGAGTAGPGGCLVKWYRDGTLYGTADLAYRLPDLADVNNWIGRSMWAADSNSNLKLNELRIYDRAISSAEVASSRTAGPDAVFEPPVTVDDSATIHADQKVLVDVLANDSGGPLPGTLEIVAPPSTGIASVDNGRILYAHSGSSSSPVTFTYRVGNVSGNTAEGTVTIDFATSLRLTNEALAMPAAPPVNTWQMVDALPGLTFNQPICITAVPGDTNRLFVCERIAKIKHVPDVTAATPVQNTFLDLQAVIAGRTPTETIEGGANAEHGLLGLAFHPQYAGNGYFYVAYTVRINGGAYYQRISRFQVNAGDPDTADPASELILLQQLDEGSNHDGGDLHFGPDGYLYYTAGDELAQRDVLQNSQKINLDFFSGIFRIDVDKKPGNLEPNPHSAIPTDGGIARFSVPVDNPFVHTSLGGTWDGFYNGNEITPLGSVRTEFWCTGLRHVWRFSFDEETGDLWAGDVGQDTYEEVNKIIKGGNYGWVYREGFHDTAFTNPVPPAKPAGFTSIDPVYEYVHTALAGDANFKGNSVVGGHVYRGTRYPSLVGTYIFSDSVSGHVWQMDTGSGATVRLTGLPGAYGVISTQGVDPSNKDPLFAAYLTGKIMRLSSGSDASSGFPATLSATGLFSDLSDLSPASGLLPYQPNLTFWSDHAIKRRWFAIPDATSHMAWSKEGNWSYPAGMLWVKHFDLELERGNPATRKRVETRVLVKTDTGAYGVSYRWNEAQTEATLVGDGGEEFDIDIDEGGTPHVQHWQIPGRSSCITCHGDNPLSFNTRQLNRDGSINGFAGNQINLLAAHDFLSNTPDPVATLGRHIAPDDTQHPVEERVRSYLAVNCAYCHQAGGSVDGFWDGRPELTLEQTGLIHGIPVNNGGSPENQYVVPGDIAHSIVLSRVAATNGFTRMPPLATSELDQSGIALLTEWIQDSLPGHPLYDQWRDGYFAPGDPDGDKAIDFDGDGLDNYTEYLLGSSPLTGTGAWQAMIGDGGSTLSFLRKAYRRYQIETSDDLSGWQPWDAPENHDGYSTSDTPVNLAIPPGDRRFFRFQVTEP